MGTFNLELTSAEIGLICALLESEAGRCERLAKHTDTESVEILKNAEQKYQELANKIDEQIKK